MTARQMAQSLRHARRSYWSEQGSLLTTAAPGVGMNLVIVCTLLDLAYHSQVLLNI